MNISSVTYKEVIDNIRRNSSSIVTNRSDFNIDKFVSLIENLQYFGEDKFLFFKEDVKHVLIDNMFLVIFGEDSEVIAIMDEYEITAEGQFGDIVVAHGHDATSLFNRTTKEFSRIR